MTFTVPQISGNLVGLDQEQRNEAIAAAVRGPVVIHGDAPDLAEALRASPGVTLDEDQATAACTLIARSERGQSLPSETVEAVQRHAGAGSPWIVDTVADDPARPALEMLDSVPLTVIAECEVVGTFLADETTELVPTMALASTVPMNVAGHAGRVLIFGGVQSPPPSAGRAVLFPSRTNELARLERQIAELEHQNRRLAEGRLGVHDAAAARAAAAATELAATRAEVAELHERLESAIFHAKQNDELFQDARLQLFASQARVATLERELYRHQIDVRRLLRRAAAKARNKIRPR